MKKQRLVLEASIALFDADYDGTADADNFYRSIWCAVNLSYRPGIGADDLKHVARGRLREIGIEQTGIGLVAASTRA
jgi:hypothetical protein